MTAEPLDPSPSVTATSRSAIERGMILMAVGVLMTPGGHAIAKLLGGEVSVGQIAWARFFFPLLLLIPLVWWGRRGAIMPPSFAHLMLGVLIAAASVFFFLALTVMPLADSAAIFFVEPLLLTVISAMFLGESIGWRRLLAVLVGFSGALIVIRPSFETVGFVAVLPLLAALSFASYLAIMRHIAPRQDGRVLQLWSSMFAVLVLSLAMVVSDQTSWPLFEPSWPTAWAWALLGCMGLISLVSQMLAIRAFRLAPAGILAPFQYLEIFGATLFGALIFDDLPDALTGLGIVIIVGSGLYVFYRERMLAQ